MEHMGLPQSDRTVRMVDTPHTERIEIFRLLMLLLTKSDKTTYTAEELWCQYQMGIYLSLLGSHEERVALMSKMELPNKTSLPHAVPSS